MGRPQSRVPVWSLGACLALGLLIGGCAGDRRLSAPATTLNREVGTLQDQLVLLNVVRRSRRQPAHFTTSLSIVRGRSRVTGGASLRVPFGAGPAERFVFEPSFGVEAGPAFELSPLNSQEFFRGFLAPVGTAALAPHLRRWSSSAVILAVVVGEIRLRAGAGEEAYVNDPEDPAAFAAFQRALGDLLDQGLTTELVDLVREVGPPFGGPAPPAPQDILAAEKQGLAVERAAAAEVPGGRPRFQMRQVLPSPRFCFAEPRTALAREARCGPGAGPGGRARVGLQDPRAFGTPGAAVAAFDAGAAGRIEIALRSPAAVLDFLGALVRAQQTAAPDALALRLPGLAERPLFVIEALPPGTPAIAAMEVEGARYAIPAGPEGGHSGDVFSFMFSFMSQLVAQAQSVRDLPASNAATIVGD